MKVLPSSGKREHVAVLLAQRTTACHHATQGWRPINTYEQPRRKKKKFIHCHYLIFYLESVHIMYNRTGEGKPHSPGTALWLPRSKYVIYYIMCLKAVWNPLKQTVLCWNYSLGTLAGSGNSQGFPPFGCPALPLCHRCNSYLRGMEQQGRTRKQCHPDYLWAVPAVLVLARAESNHFLSHSLTRLRCGQTQTHRNGLTAYVLI